MIKNKRILIAGGAGSIGSELVRQLVLKNKLFILDINESAVHDLTEELKEENAWVHGRVGDIRNETTIHDIFSDFKPQIVINAAALKHVPLSYLYPDDYVETNIQGNSNLIKEAKKWECLEKYIYISTDKVHSRSPMGATKNCGEKITISMGKKFIAVRFGNVMNSRGSVLPIWQRQMNQQKPITVTDIGMKRYMMSMEEACNLVIKAIELGEGGEIICFDMGDLVNIHELAKEILKKSGSGLPIKVIGIRPGEVLEEKLMTEEEKLSAIKKERFWIIK